MQPMKLSRGAVDLLVRQRGREVLSRLADKRTLAEQRDALFAQKAAARQAEAVQRRALPSTSFRDITGR